MEKEHSCFGSYDWNGTILEIDFETQSYRNEKNLYFKKFYDESILFKIYMDQFELHLDQLQHICSRKQDFSI